MDLLRFVEEVALQAGELILDKRREPLKLTPKGSRDVVTDADIACQHLITDQVSRVFPEHGFLTEEEDSSLATSRDVTWIIDPIDGTINYSRGQPIFSVSIAIAVGGDLRVGVVYDPVHDELFSAEVGRGFFVNKRPCETRPVSELGQAVVSFDWKHTRELRQSVLMVLDGLIHEVRTVNVIGSAALSLAWIAAGRVDGYFNPYLDPWDVAAGAVLIREAYGQVSHYSGEKWNWQSADKTCIASTNLIHASLVEAVNRQIQLGKHKS